MKTKYILTFLSMIVISSNTYAQRSLSINTGGQYFGLLTKYNNTNISGGTLMYNIGIELHLSEYISSAIEVGFSKEKRNQRSEFFTLVSLDFVRVFPLKRSKRLFLSPRYSIITSRYISTNTNTALGGVIGYSIAFGSNFQLGLNVSVSKYLDPEDRYSEDIYVGQSIVQAGYTF